MTFYQRKHYQILMPEKPFLLVPKISPNKIFIYYCCSNPEAWLLSMHHLSLEYMDTV